MAHTVPTGHFAARTIPFAMSVLRRLSKAVEFKLRYFFFRLGYTVSGHPFKTIGLSLLLVALLCIGITSLRTEQRLEELWVPQGTLALEHKLWQEENFESGVRPEQLILTSVTLNGDVATQAALQDLIRVMQVTEDTTSTYNGTEITFESVCFKNEEFCQMTSVLDLFYDEALATTPPNFLATVQTKINALTDAEIKTILSTGPYQTWNGQPIQRENIMGGLSGDGSTFRVEAFRVTILLENNEVVQDGEAVDAIAESWETAWIVNVIDTPVPNVTTLNIYANALVSIKQAMEESISGDVMLFAVGYTLLILYVSVQMGDFHTVRSRVVLAGLAIFSVVLAFGATVGLASWMGMFYGPVHQVLPLLLLGIGIDDAFVITTAYDGLDPQLPLREKIARALSQAGAAVTVTSVTNSCTFFIGSLTNLPALRYFAIWAGMGIIFDYVLQTTFFVACLTLDARRQEKGQLDVFCCFVSKDNKVTNVFGKATGSFRRFFANRLGPWILKPVVRTTTLLVTLAVFGVCVYGTTQLEQSFQPSFFYLEGSYSKEFDDMDLKYFDVDIPFNIYTGQLDYPSTRVQQQMTELFTLQTGLIDQDPYVQEGTLESWYLAFRQHENLTLPEQVVPPTEYYSRLLTFVTSEAGSRFQRDLIPDPTTQELVATKSYATFVYLKNNDEEVAAMQSIRATVDRAGLTEAFPYQFLFIFFEQYAVIKTEVVTNIVAALSVVLVIAVVLIGDPFVALITLLGVGFSVLDILGIMYFWGIELNSISVINLSLAVGLTIDFSAHIGLAFMEAVGTKSERSIAALANLGPALWHGGFSTFLAISVLVVARSYIFRVFFKMFVLIIGLGMFHGMIVVPQILSLVGPVGFFATVEEKHETEEQIVHAVIEKKSVVKDGSDDETAYVGLNKA